MTTVDPVELMGRNVSRVEVMVALSDAQVAQVLLEACDGASLLSVFSGLADSLHGHPAADEGSECSQPVLRALLLLTAFPTDGTQRRITDVSRQLGLSPATAHRYAVTWMAVGVLEQDPRSRMYRRASRQHAPRLAGSCV